MSNPIGWCDVTWNPIIGCSRVSDGCRNCYAERMAARLAANPATPQYKATVKGGHWSGKTVLVESALEAPLHWKKPRRIFVCSMSDLFHESVPDGWIDCVYSAMSRCEQHTFYVLTKRPARMHDFCRRYAPPTPMRAVYGVSVEDQPTAEARIPALLSIPGIRRMVSYEPALRPVDFTRYIACEPTIVNKYHEYVSPLSGWYSARAGGSGTGCYGPKIDWLIAGGESGPGARPAHPDWFRSVRDDCAAAGVPFWFKQEGGLHGGGRLLDGREHNGSLE